MKKKYNFICPNCNYKQSAAPCFAMQNGLNEGHGTCVNCKAFLHLEISPDINGDHMVAVLWDDYMNKKKKVNT